MFCYGPLPVAAKRDERLQDHHPLEYTEVRIWVYTGHPHLGVFDWYKIVEKFNRGIICKRG
jgi:hypothetical protein